jgi:hypothetical protein
MAKVKTESLLKYYGFTAAEQKKYPVVSGILKQLTPERIQKEVEEIKKIELPEELQKWVKEYEKVGERDGLLWKWLYGMFKIVHLPFVPESIEKKLLNIKLLFTMFITLLDDVADRNGNKALLQVLLEIPFRKKNFNFDKTKLNAKEIKFFELTLDLWHHILYLMQKDLVNNEKYQEIFNFDLFQALNEMRYAHFFSKYPYLINKNEYWAFLSYNMCLYVYCDLDLMTSVKFNIKKAGMLREITWDIQKTARIGNWLSTWKRELKENDYSSIVFAYYFENEYLSLFDKTVGKNNTETLKEIKKQKIEKEIFIEWEKSYQNIKNKKNKDIKVHSILKFSKKLLSLHLTNIGYI